MSGWKYKIVLDRKLTKLIEDSVLIYSACKRVG